MGTGGRMAADKEALKLYVAGQQKFHDELTTAHIGVINRIVTYIGAVLAFLTFLYIGALDTTKSVAERLFIPDELYGKIFYVAGLFFILLALGRLIHGFRPNGTWSVGFRSSDINEIEEMDEEAYLIKLKNDNDEARKSNISQYEKAFGSLKAAFYPLLIGAIVLIVLRYFQ